MVGSRSALVAVPVLAAAMALSGCLSGGAADVITETATVTAPASTVSSNGSPSTARTSDPAPPTSGSSAPSTAVPGEQVSYDEIARRVYFVYRSADEIGTAPSLPKTREAWDRFSDAATQLAGLVVLDFSEAGGSGMRALIAEFAEAAVVFANYQSKWIDDRAYCEGQGDKSAQQECMRRISDPNDWRKSFEDLFTAGGAVLDAIPD